MSSIQRFRPKLLLLILWSCGYHYLCRLGGWYLFRLDMIELEQTAEGCRVTQWSQPCEAFGEEVFDWSCR